MEPPVSCDDIAEQQAYSKKAKDYLQTPRKPKTESSSQFEEDNEVDDEDGPYKKVDMFVKSDPLRGLSDERRLQYLEDYVSKSTKESCKLARKTGRPCSLVRTFIIRQ